MTPKYLDEERIEAVFDELVKMCTCGSCERYRRYVDAKVAGYSVKLRRAMGIVDV